jgi:hypothetical protein
MIEGNKEVPPGPIPQTDPDADEDPSLASTWLQLQTPGDRRPGLAWSGRFTLH